VPRRFRLPFALALLVPVSARADLRLHYEAYAVGLPDLDLRVSLDMNAEGYAIGTSLRVIGLIGTFFDGDSVSTVSGTWHDATVRPISFQSHGRWGGELRQTVIDYRDGQPLIRTLVPPNQTEREPVPVALQANTVDTLSAMALLIHQVATTGRCEAQTRIFDGRRLSQVVAHTVGLVELPDTSRSVFQGPALRCDFDGRMLAGFRHDDNRAEQARPQHGSAWLAPIVPGGPALPVRIQFETPFFGTSTMYLVP
jgi:hypothetical protein